MTGETILEVSMATELAPLIVQIVRGLLAASACAKLLDLLRNWWLLL